MSVISVEMPKKFSGEPVKMTLTSTACYFACPPTCADPMVQKLTIVENGRVTFTSKKFSSLPDRVSRGEWAKQTLIPFVAKELIEAVAEIFRTVQFETYITDVGKWELAITNSQGEVYNFSGSLSSDAFDACKQISDLIRAKINIPELWCFDGESDTPDKATSCEWHDD